MRSKAGGEQHVVNGDLVIRAKAEVNLVIPHVKFEHFALVPGQLVLLNRKVQSACHIR